MQITITLPDDIAEHPAPGREALEAVAIEGYRSEALSHYEAAQLLGLSRYQFDGFLKEREILDHAYGAQDLLDDIETIKKLEGEGKFKTQRSTVA